MSTDKMREEFLAWISKRKLVTRNKASLRMNSDGSQFLDYRVNDLWCAWQASRAALVVELPEYLDFDRIGFAAYDASEVEGALEATGVKVKP